jgi:hypothetical protein
MGSSFAWDCRRAVSGQPKQDDYYSSTAPMSSMLPKRKTKMVCTIGPATWDRETLFRLADEGMNVARLNMSHGDHKSHGAVIELIREYNALGRGNVALLLDTKVRTSQPTFILGPHWVRVDYPSYIALQAWERLLSCSESGESTD